MDPVNWTTLPTATSQLDAPILNLASLPPPPILVESKNNPSVASLLDPPLTISALVTSPPLPTTTFAVAPLHVPVLPPLRSFTLLYVPWV